MSMLMIAAAVAAETLAPSGRWVVDYADSMCVLQRQFGSGADAVLFALRPYPIADTFEIVLVAADRGGPRVRRGPAQLMIAQSSTVSSDYVSVRLPGENKRLTAFSVKREELSPIGGAKTLTVVAGKVIATIAPTQVLAAMKALQACQDDLLKGWGVDTAALAAIATPAEPVSPSIRWLTHNDYPTQAIRESREGMTAILWTIGVDGRVSNCRVVASSGHADLDQVGCNAITRRGRYKPALGKDGKPTVAWASRRIRWLLPDG